MIHNNLEIDHNEEFGTLANAPIVEAVLHWHAVATTDFFDSNFTENLQTAFTEYQCENQQSLSTGITGNQQGINVSHKTTLHGARLTSHDGRFVCQFIRDGVVFSQLKPYADWNSLIAEARKFWIHFQQVAAPNEITRLAVRYISQIPVENARGANSYIENVCQPLSAITLSADEYFHQDTIKLENYPYSINLVRAVQSSPNQQKHLLVDISAYTRQQLGIDSDIETTLEDLRFIKNKVFFTLMNNPDQKFGQQSNV